MIEITAPNGRKWTIPEQPERQYPRYDVDQLTYPARGMRYFGVEIAPFVYILTGPKGTTLQPPMVGIKPPGMPNKLYTILSWDDFLLELERSKNRAYQAPKNAHRYAGRGGKI